MSSLQTIFLEQSLNTLFLEVLNMALSATWIMLAFLLFRALLKKWLPRRVMLWGWLLVAIRLICPVTIESVISLVPSGKPVPLDIPYDHTPALDLGVPLVERPVNDLISHHLTPAPGDSANPMQILIFIAAVVWLIGVVGLLIYTLVSYLLLRRRVRMAVKVPDGEIPMNLPPRVTLWQCETVQSPFIFGVICPRIYLPYGMDSDTTAHVLSHEMAHLRRWDHVIKLISFLICTVYWFHPLVWLCYLLYSRDMEAACDERVVKNMDDSTRRAYARALLTCESGSRRRVFCPPAFGETDVKSRIKGVLSYKKPLFWLIMVAILILAALGACLLTDPAEEYVNIPSDWYGISHVTETICDEPGFTMTPEDFVWENGRIIGLRMRFENDTAYGIGYGEPFRLYRDEGAWVDAALTDTIFHLPLYLIPAGGEATHYYDLSHYDLSVHTRYRFVILIDVAINEYGTTESKEAYIEFTVSGADALATPRPADFAIRFESQIGKNPNVLDTFDGYIQKDMVLGIPPTTKTDYTPTEAELQYLWYLVESRGVTSMPADMHPIQLGDTQVAVEPNTEYTITIRANGRIYTVKGDSVTCAVEGERNARFRSFVGEMYYFMTSTGQWKSLPEALGGYA